MQQTIDIMQTKKLLFIQKQFGASCCGASGDNDIILVGYSLPLDDPLSAAGVELGVGPGLLWPPTALPCTNR